MNNLPFIGTTIKPGINQAITNATDTDPILVPKGSTGCVLYFHDGTDLVEGRIGFNYDNTAITGIDEHELGWFFPSGQQYDQKPTYTWDARDREQDQLVMHVASAATGAVAKGFWIFTKPQD